MGRTGRKRHGGESGRELGDAVEEVQHGLLGPDRPFGEPASVADRQQLIEGLKTLAGIKEVKKLMVGTPSPTEQRGVVDNSYDVSELMFFDSIEGQNAYQVHPIHKAFVEQYSHLWDKVVVYDMDVV